ncbi:hypothetical protein BYT27DRAFT_7208652 [Phlegmacium glaucopus]|nr:hypothetical protein BYT27DRAFT_7208652 [Phlegmacium glaucopus]
MEWVACQKIFWGWGLDKMGSHILLGIGLGWNGWPARTIIWGWGGSGLDQMGGPVQTKWVAIYCWVSAWDGMGGLPENILGLGSGPNGWPGPDKMGSHILLGIGLGWNGVQTKWVAIYCWVSAWDGMGGRPENNLGMGSGLDQMGGPVQTKWVAIYCWVSAWDGMGGLPENILGLGSGPNGWPGPDKMGSHILLACQNIFWGSGLDQMGGPVQTKWVAIYCWVSAWDGMGSLPEHILGLGSGPNGWPGPDKMGSHILLACQNIFWGSGLDQMGGPVQTKWVAIYCWVSAWDGMGSLPEHILGLGSEPNGWPGPDKMGSHILLGIGLGWNGWLARK